MAGSCTDQGVFTQLLLEPGAAPHTFDSSSERYEFLWENVSKHGRIIGGNGIRGTRSKASERTRKGAYYVFGTIAMNISPGEFVTLLPKILGADASGTTFALAEQTPYFGMLIDRGADVFEYTDCKVNRAILRGRAPQMNEEGEPELLELQLQIMGKTETTATSWPGSPPSLSTNGNVSPFVLSDGVLTMQSATWPFEEFVLVIDNHLEARFVNSLTAYTICPRDRTVMLRARVPWGEDNVYSTLYGQALAGATGSLAFTNGTVSTTFTFGTLQVPDNSPVVQGKRGISLELDMIARSVTTTKEVSVTNDSTV